MEVRPGPVTATRRVGGLFGSHPDSPQRCGLCRPRSTYYSVGEKVEHLRRFHGAIVWREDGLMHYEAAVPA